MSTNTDAANRTFTLKRTINAPISLVWEAWTTPDHIKFWWGPKGMETRIVKHDFQVGGQWKYTMTMPDGNEFVTEGEYLLIEAMKKLFTTANFRPMTEGVEIQTFFEANGDQTDFTFCVVHETEEYHKQQEKMGIAKGWGSVISNLEAHIESIKKN